MRNMRARTLDLGPTNVHGQPRSPAAGPVGSVPPRPRSIGKIVTPWLRIMLVAQCVGAVLGPLHAAADMAAPHGAAAAGPHLQVTAKTAEQPTATPTVCSAHMGAQPGTWMRDIDPCIRYRRLTDIVIPGSHDSTTYSLTLVSLAQTQSVDLIGQLNAGARQFDIRVRYWDGSVPNSPPEGWYANHGTISGDLTLNHIFNDLATWANEADHGQEIIMVNLTIDPDDSGKFPTDDCKDLAGALGGNLVTPVVLLNNFGTTDPGEVTFGQLWSLPSSGGARVILDNTDCLTAAIGGSPQQGPWGPFLPPGQTLFSGYYADQCTADGIEVPENNQYIGIWSLVMEAAETPRATWGPGGPTPITVGPPKVGGLHVLSIQGTPEFGCVYTPLAMVPDEQTVFTRLTNLWYNAQTAGELLLRKNLNVVAGDFIDGTWLWVPIVNMDVVATPPDPPTITGLTSGPGQVSVAFDAPADQGTAPVTSYTVVFGPPFKSVTGTSSPITVTGLTNGQEYIFAMSATNAAGTGEQTGYSDPITVGGAPPAIDDGPAYTGFVGKSYLSRFAVRGTRGTTVRLASGQIPPGLTLGNDGTLAGIPTQAGEYEFGVRATNRFGSHAGVAQLVISDPGTTGAPRPETSWQPMRANICTTRAKGRPECASRLLLGPFPQLEDRALVSLVRGPVTYATGHVTGDGRLTLRGEQPTAGHYTLVIRDQRSTFVPVTVH